MVKRVQLVGRLRDRATALFGGKIRIVVATTQHDVVLLVLHTFSAFLAVTKKAVQKKVVGGRGEHYNSVHSFGLPPCSGARFA